MSVAVDLPTIARARATAQGVARPSGRSAGEVVRRLLAVQGQEWPSASWAVAMRTRAPRVEALDRALRSGELVRTWVFRGTLFVLPAKDLGWLHGLVAERVLRGAASRHRQLGLDARTFAKAEEVMASELSRGKKRPRGEVAEALEAAGVSTKGQRFPHLLFHAAYRGVVLQCGVTKNEPLYRAAGPVLRAGTRLEGDAALVALAERYFAARGPATLRDLAWYAGLPMGEVKRGLMGAHDAGAVERIEGTELWQASHAKRPLESGIRMVPAFDELLLAYQDRDATIEPRHIRKWTPGGGAFAHLVIEDGHAIGTWKRTFHDDVVRVVATPFSRWTTSQKAGLREEAERFARAWGVGLDLRAGGR